MKMAKYDDRKEKRSDSQRENKIAKEESRHKKRNALKKSHKQMGESEWKRRNKTGNEQ